MSSGCLCCTIGGDLASTLKDAHWRFSRDGERQFDRVVIETTGLADPAPIIPTLMTGDVIARRYQLDIVLDQPLQERLFEAWLMPWLPRARLPPHHEALSLTLGLCDLTSPLSPWSST